MLQPREEGEEEATLTVSRDTLFAGCTFSMALHVPHPPVGVTAAAVFRALLAARFRVLWHPEQTQSHLLSVCPECATVSIIVAACLPGKEQKTLTNSPQSITVTADQCAVGCRRPSAHILRFLHTAATFVVAEVALPWSSSRVVCAAPAMLADTLKAARAILGSINGELHAPSGVTTGVRIFQVLPEYADRIRIIASSFLPRVAKLPGFLNYAVNANDHGLVITFTQFREKEFASTSMTLAQSTLTNSPGHENPAHLDLIACGIIRILVTIVTSE